MTQKIYETDSYVQSFTARVLQCSPSPGGFAVVLDRTAFFPEGGGQPADRGTLTLPDGTVQHYEEDVNERYLREMNYFLDYAAGEETESLNPPATALQVLKLTLGEQQ